MVRLTNVFYKGGTRLEPGALVELGPELEARMMRGGTAEPVDAVPEGDPTAEPVDAAPEGDPTAEPVDAAPEGDPTAESAAAAQTDGQTEFAPAAKKSPKMGRSR